MKIINQTKIQLSTLDALRALLGRTIHLTTEIETTAETEVLATSQTILIDSLMRRGNKGSHALAAVTQEAPAQ